VDVRIGVQQTPKEIEIEMASNVDRSEVRASIDAALADAAGVLWLTDRHGRDIAVPSAKIAYIELGSSDSERRIGFGAG
jgi:hypothetical protein